MKRPLKPPKTTPLPLRIIVYLPHSCIDWVIVAISFTLELSESTFLRLMCGWQLKNWLLKVKIFVCFLQQRNVLLSVGLLYHLIPKLTFFFQFHWPIILASLCGGKLMGDRLIALSLIERRVCVCVFYDLSLYIYSNSFFSLFLFFFLIKKYKSQKFFRRVI